MNRAHPSKGRSGLSLLAALGLTNPRFLLLLLRRYWLVFALCLAWLSFRLLSAGVRMLSRLPAKLAHKLVTNVARQAVDVKSLDTEAVPVS